jgi:redox-sensitive bicupin YhaK (pirin superfamily)
MFWVRSPDDAPPRFVKQTVPRADRRERLVAVAGGEGGIPLRADAAVHTGALAAGTLVRHRLGDGRGAYLVSTDGAISVDGRTAGPGDRVLVTGAGTVAIGALAATEVVLLDIPLSRRASRA